MIAKLPGTHQREKQMVKTLRNLSQMLPWCHIGLIQNKIFISLTCLVQKKISGDQSFIVDKSLVGLTHDGRSRIAEAANKNLLLLLLT